MENRTDYPYFKFSIFVNIGPYQYPVFVFCLLLYGFIVFANLIIIVVILRDRALHKSMYVFIAFLSVNSLYGSTGFFPRFLMDILSDSHLISRPACFTQIYIIYTYAFCELTLLSIMSYDRYVAICQPLHYHSKMTCKTVSQLGAIAWICPSIYLTVSVYVAQSLHLCGNEIEKVYCAAWNVVKLACVTPIFTQMIATAGAAVITFVPVSCILYTYLRITFVCWKSSSEFKGKAFKTCLPHITALMVYCVTSLSDTLLNRYNQLDPPLAITLSLEFVLFPPLLNPLIYGLKLPEIKIHIVRMLCFKTAVCQCSLRCPPKSRVEGLNSEARESNT